MGLHQHVRNTHLVLQVRARSLVAGVLVAADVIPGPAIECALLDLSGVFERRVVAKSVALVDDAPRTAGRRLNGDAGAVAQPRGNDLLVLAVRIEGEDVGAAALPCPRSRRAVRWRSKAAGHP